MGDRILGPGSFVMNRGMLLGLEQKRKANPQRAHWPSVFRSRAWLSADLGSVAMLFSRRRRPWKLIVASVVASLTTLVFLGYPSVAYGVLLDLAILGALLWTY